MTPASKKGIALVTGASRGIGAATAKLLAQRGYAVCVNYVKQADAANAVIAAIDKNGGKAFTCQADVSQESEVQRLFAEIDSFAQTRALPLAVLINNAGILLPQMPLDSMTAERINRLLSTNVTSAFLCAREAVKRMKPEQNGAIVSVSSAAARLGSPNEYIDYAASKGAIDTLTIGLAKEVAAFGIRVNAVRPGFIDTTMHADGGMPDRIERFAGQIPLQRGGSAEEVAQAIVWLASEKASYVTGELMDIAGGR